VRSLFAQMDFVGFRIGRPTDTEYSSLRAGLSEILDLRSHRVGGFDCGASIPRSWVDDGSIFRARGGVAWSDVQGRRGSSTSAHGALASASAFLFYSCTSSTACVGRWRRAICCCAEAARGPGFTGTG